MGERAGKRAGRQGNTGGFRSKGANARKRCGKPSGHGPRNTPPLAHTQRGTHLAVHLCCPGLHGRLQVCVYEARQHTRGAREVKGGGGQQGQALRVDAPLLHPQDRVQCTAGAAWWKAAESHWWGRRRHERAGGRPAKPCARRAAVAAETGKHSGRRHGAKRQGAASRACTPGTAGRLLGVAGGAVHRGSWKQGVGGTHTCGASGLHSSLSSRAAQWARKPA